jgi:hypothetical protein
MAIEFFKKEGRGFAPKASVRMQGHIGFNGAAVERFKIKNGQDVLLGYDRERRMVVIKPVDKPEPGSKKTVVRGKNGSISARGFFDYFDIPHKKGRSYLLELDEKNNFLSFCLEEEGGIKTGNHE